jgi:hypothetical protein
MLCGKHDDTLSYSAYSFTSNVPVHLAKAAGKKGVWLVMFNYCSQEDAGHLVSFLMPKALFDLTR